MKTALVEIRADSETVLREMGDRFIKAWDTGKSSNPIATFSFSNASQLFAVFTPKRWELIQKLQELGPSSIRGLTRALGRDVRRVHDDVAVLIDWGIVERDEAGKVFVPYDVIHIDAAVRAAA
jgi:predicted transcriptional regulator